MLHPGSASALVASLLLALFVGAGCEQGCQRDQTSAPRDAGTRLALGTVEGVVRLAPGATVPSYADDPAPQIGTKRPPAPAQCPPPRTDDRQPVRLVADRALSGVLVTASEFARTPEHAPITHSVEIHGCRLAPTLVAATRGDQLRVLNGDDYPFLPTMGSGGLMQALTRGQDRIMPLDRGGVFTLSCGWAVGCGRTDVIVLQHPVHAITDHRGRFRIENVPADDDLKIHAWHPLLHDVTVSTRVGVGRSVHLELTVQPSGAPPMPTPAPIDAGRRAPF